MHVEAIRGEYPVLLISNSIYYSMQYMFILASHLCWNWWKMWVFFYFLDLVVEHNMYSNWNIQLTTWTNKLNRKLSVIPNEIFLKPRKDIINKFISIYQHLTWRLDLKTYTLHDMCARSEECLQLYIKHNNTFYFRLSFIKIVYICLKLCSNVSVQRT